MPQIIGGNLRALGTASAKRDEVLPDVPTLDEQGYPRCLCRQLVRAVRAGAHAARR